MEKEYCFKIELEGVQGHLTYSVFAESEQEAKDMVSFFIQSLPFIITKLWEYPNGKSQSTLAG